MQMSMLSLEQRFADFKGYIQPFNEAVNLALNTWGIVSFVKYC